MRIKVTDWKNRFTGIILFLSHCSIVVAQTHTITGYVTDAATGEALIQANVYQAQSYKGTTTNEYGFYSLSLPAGEVTLKSAYVGYQSYMRYLQLHSDTTIHISLDLATMDEVVVTAPKAGDELLQNNTRMSTIRLPMQQIESVPALFGEPDLLKAYALTPGVSTGVEGSAGLLVRGGTPDQNLILLDGATVYNVAHLFGFVSIFNTDALKNAELIKGGFPARYGGRLSSVLDISMKEGNTEKAESELGVGLISSRYTINGPINEKTSYLLAGRTNYIGLLLLPLLTGGSGNQEVALYNMYDFNAKLNHRFNDQQQLYLSLYAGNDYLGASDFSQNPVERSRFLWGNVTGTMRYTNVLSPKMFGKFMLNYSQYRAGLRVKEVYTNKTDVTRLSSIVRDLSMKADIDFLPNPAHYIRFGATGIYHQYQPNVTRSRSTDTDGFETTNNFNTPAGEFALYAEDDISLTKWWKLNAGFRGVAFAVEDEWYLSPEPRISSRFLLGNWALKSSYSYMQQHIHLLAGGSGPAGVPGSDIWVPATANVPPQRAWQAAAGIGKSFPKQHLDISVEGYYKKMNDVIDFLASTSSFFGNNGNWEERVETGGEGTAYGLEFFLHRKRGRLNGWLAYTLSWNNRRFERINNGRTYPAAYDRRHDAAVVLNYRLGKKVDFSAAWVYATGSPITLPTANYYNYGNNINFPVGYHSPQEHYGSRNNFRMPDNHRLDINFTFNKKTRKGRDAKWNLGLYNAYNRANPLFLQVRQGATYVSIDGGPLELESVSKRLTLHGFLPLLPSISYNIKY